MVKQQHVAEQNVSDYTGVEPVALRLTVVRSTN